MTFFGLQTGEGVQLVVWGLLVFWILVLLVETLKDVWRYRPRFGKRLASRKKVC